MVQRLRFAKLSPGLRRAARRLGRDRGYIILEEKGTPVAGVMDIDEMEDYLELRDPELHKQIDEGYQEHRAGKTRPLDEVIKELKLGTTRTRSKAAAKKRK